MTFAQSIQTCLSKYATFQGRAMRSEYWWFFLFYVLGNAVLGGLFGALVFPSLREIGEFGAMGIFLGIVMALFNLALLMPLWAVAVRRFHDRGLSGWIYLALILAGLVPYVGFLASIGSLVITILPTKEGANRYGPDPRLGTADVF